MTNATEEEIIILDSVAVADLPDDVLPADILPKVTDDINTLSLWVVNVLEEAICELGLEGEVCYVPELALEHGLDDDQQPTLATRLHKPVWNGLAVALARLWVVEKRQYVNYAAVLNSPTWLQLCLQVHLMVWASGQREQHNPDEQLWLSGLDDGGDRLAQFGTVPVYRCVFGF